MPIDFRKPQYFKEFRFGSTLVWSTIREILVPTIVSGVSPLSLVNAVAHTLSKLTQSGKCVQNGTPTPSNPVGIKCNNGTLMMVDDELPVGYKRIASIKFDGDFWYDTEESLTGNDDVTMTLANTSTTGQNVFGSYNGTSTGKKNFSLFIYGSSSTSNSYLRYGEQLLRPRFGSNERTITFGKSGSDGFATDVSAPTPDTFTTPANTYIGMLPNSTSPAFTGRIVGSILVGDRLKYVPCERVSDGTIGYYEAIKGVFLEPVGTGVPIAGDYDGSHYSLSVVGTPEVLTIGNQTASAVDLYQVGDYADEQDIISGAVARNMQYYVLDGTEEWTFIADNYQDGTHRIHWDGFRASSSISTSDPPILCSHFVKAPLSDRAAQTGQNGKCYVSSISFHMRSTEFTSLATAKAWLAAQYAKGTPVIIVCPLREPTTEQVAAQTLKTAKGTNIITVQANVDDIPLEVEYYTAG